MTVNCNNAFLYDFRRQNSRKPTQPHFLDRVFKIRFRYSIKAYQNRIGLMEARFLRSDIVFIHLLFLQTEVFRVAKSSLEPIAHITHPCVMCKLVVDISNVVMYFTLMRDYFIAIFSFAM